MRGVTRAQDDDTHSDGVQPMPLVLGVRARLLHHHGVSSAEDACSLLDLSDQADVHAARMPADSSTWRPDARGRAEC